ncbi:MAG: hypothetical protein Fues2KO_26350 [Fuerstiella sp.]
MLLPLLAWFWGGTSTAITIAAGVGLLLVVLAWSVPAVVRPIYIGLTVVTYPIGLVVSELILLTVFMVVMCPIGLLFRVLGRDSLSRNFDRSATTYWIPRPTAKPAKSYFRQH